MSKKRYIPRLLNAHADLINNVIANYFLSPLFFLIVFIVLESRGLTAFGTHTVIYGAFPLAIISTCFYLYCSSFFQPDLDVGPKRPGMGYFPFGAWTLKIPAGPFLRAAGYPLNRIWYAMWTPYSLLLTHRGIGHWPVIGTWVRVGYLYLCLLGSQKLLLSIGLKLKLISTLILWAKAFYPWSPAFFGMTWIVFCFPVYMADIIHILVDYFDSYRKGISFCPPQIPRGYICASYLFVKKMIEK
jgi:uncharacterized metal-binding protein